MTTEEAGDILIKHNQFFELYAKELYVPRACESIVGEILEAYKVLNPHWQNVCQSCGNELIIDANRHRLARLKQLEPKHYTFPKQ